jgi:predicted patatin/cPLA2 family phospholipase
MAAGGRWKRWRNAIAALAVAASAAGCATEPARTPYTQQELQLAQLPGFPGVRMWADDPNLISARAEAIGRFPGKTPVVLALSGGGPDGAFGAGLLSGWTARGDRPAFDIVTGASAGALMSPFAFLGPAYDDRMRQVFATDEMANFLQFEGVSGLFGTGLFKTAPLKQLIARHVDENVLAAIAQEYRKGRRLFIVTTNLDGQRTAIWDMGRIASSGNPNALELFRRVMEASASIPGIFAPVLIQAEAEGRNFSEMHVDGGITANVMVVPEAFLINNSNAMPRNVRPRIYVVINGKLGPNFEMVTPRTLRIAIRSFETSVRANTRNTLLASYEYVRRRGWNLRLAAMADDYPEGPNQGFDANYMRTLFEYGHQRGLSGNPWQDSPADSPRPVRSQQVAAQ